MILAVLGFIAMFLVVFLLFIVISRVMARKAREKEDQIAWEEGHRRRSQAAEDEAWKANKRMPMK
jgi:NADH:ubiquinone oxidoreductase subunit 3 (subunit A)